jgi:hypothetical protein
MKKLICILCIFCGIATSASAQFSLPGGLGGGKSSGGGEDVGVLVEKFNTQNFLISKVVAFSLEQIIGALGDKETIAQERAKYESIEKETNPQEKAKKEGQLIKDSAAQAQKLLDSNESKEKIKNMSPEMQKKVSKAILSVGIAGLQIPGMIDTGKKAIEAAGSNPMQLPKVLPLKDGVAVFIDTLPKIVKIASTGFSLLKDVKVKADSPTADAKLSAPDTNESPFPADN